MRKSCGSWCNMCIYLPIATLNCYIPHLQSEGWYDEVTKNNMLLVRFAKTG